METITRLGDETLFTAGPPCCTGPGPAWSPARWIGRMSGRQSINPVLNDWFLAARSFGCLRNQSARLPLTGMDKPYAKTSHREKPEKIPAAGPHAKPELTDPDKTPGAGT